MKASIAFTDSRKSSGMQKLLDFFAAEYVPGMRYEYRDFETLAWKFRPALSSEEEHAMAVEDIQYSLEAYNFPPKFKGDQLLFIMAFGNLFTALQNILVGKQPGLRTFEGLVRQVSPPLEAFNKVGNNETNVKVNRHSYSSLFE